MLEALFGADMPLAVRFFLAFLIVLGLIGATAWAVRRFGAGRLGGAGARGRQPRLAVIDYASSRSRWARRRAPGRASNLTSSPPGRCRNTVKPGRRARRARPWPLSPTRLPRGRSRCRAAALEAPRDHVRWSRAARHVRNPERSRACRRARGRP